jgi:hypothetical protein
MLFELLVIHVTRTINQITVDIIQLLLLLLLLLLSLLL